MANTYFQFKQFTVQQDKCAMKVCTDASLFGAWVAGQIENEKLKVESVLDIGAGTGLLSLLLAQKTIAQIDAVEIDEASAEQAEENFNTSPWKKRLRLHQSFIQQFNQSTSKQYEVIISNPPFFEQSLKSTDNKKTNAKHTVVLSFEDLTSIVSGKLQVDGTFYILLPYYEFQKFNEVANAKQLYLSLQVNIKQTEKHNFFRTIGVFSKDPPSNIITEEITIKINNQYSPEFVALLKDYYLHL